MLPPGPGATAADLAEGLDFQVLAQGSVIRRSTLHAKLGGQRQGGISTPARYPIVLLFTGASGSQHGYEDRWSNGVFCYFGEGQVGDMRWVRGNAAVRDHVKNGRDLVLFENLREPRKHVRYLGNFNAASWEYRSAPDRNRSKRRAIVFHLIPADRPSGDEGMPAIQITSSLDELRRAAYDAGAVAPDKTVQQAQESYIRRSVAVRAYVLARACGVCESCSRTAPFISVTGLPYLEVHHIHRLADGGPDRPEAVAAICPNCHREAHFSRDARSLNDHLSKKIMVKEGPASWSGPG